MLIMPSIHSIFSMHGQLFPESHNVMVLFANVTYMNFLNTRAVGFIFITTASDLVVHVHNYSSDLLLLSCCTVEILV